MSYSIFDVANWFLSQATMSPKKLQKLCYYAEAWTQTLLEKGLVNNTQFQAWRHGPVSHELYQKYKEYGWNNIPMLTEYENIFADDEPVLNVLHSVWQTYGDKSANELEALTHQDDPWILARNRADADHRDASQEIILPDDMKAFYGKLYQGD